MARRTPVSTPRTDVTMQAEVRAGLMAVQKKLPEKYLYDRRGVELFDRLVQQPEHHAARAETAILGGWADAIVGGARLRSFVELGVRNPSASRALLGALRRIGGRIGGRIIYAPVDGSADLLDRATVGLRSVFPELDIRPLIADLTAPLVLPAPGAGAALVACLGGTVGSVHGAAAVKLLRRIHARLRPGDRFLLGTALRTDPDRMVAACNDAAGVTAEFNRNILRVVNGRLGADFDPEQFSHRAFYNRTARRVEMHLVSAVNQAVTIPGVGVIEIEEGETIRTQIAWRYDRQAIEDLFADSGLRLDEWRTDARGDFGVALGAALQG